MQFRTERILTIAVLAAASAWTQSRDTAEDLYQRTQYEASLALLDKNSQDAATEFLIGRDYFMLGDFKKSSDYLQRATAAKPSNGEYMDWLGRAFGKRAELSNPLMAPALASKARQAFEKSVQLDDRNPDSLSDLFDFYLEAPGFLGGGSDKAQAVLEKIKKVDPVEAYFEEAKIDQHQRQFDAAERHLREAIAATPQKVSSLLTYARFLAKTGRTHESDTVLEQAQKIDPKAPSVWYTRADLLVHEKRNLPEAKTLLQRYLTASLSVDDPPKSDAQKLLKEVGGA